MMCGDATTHFEVALEIHSIIATFTFIGINGIMRFFVSAVAFYCEPNLCLLLSCHFWRCTKIVVLMLMP